MRNNVISYHAMFEWKRQLQYLYPEILLQHHDGVCYRSEVEGDDEEGAYPADQQEASQSDLG